jgi:serine/threonine protein kinase
MADGSPDLPLHLGRAIASGSFSTIYKTVGDSQRSVVKVTKRHTWLAIVEKYGSSLTFTSEVDMLSKLSHPNVMNFLSYAATESSVYMELPYMTSGSLYEYIERTGPCNDANACALGSEILSAINHAHLHDILHRDIKLENVLCTGKPTPVSLQLCDFGLSKHVGTGCLTLCGTPFYKAPELHAAHRVFPLPGYGFEVDAWSFGVLYYILHYQEFPFDEDSQGEPDFTSMWQSSSEAFVPPIHVAAQRILTGLLTLVPAERLGLRDLPQHHWLHSNP